MNTQKSLRGEIQGLRAVAVALVLIFHIWPDVLPGGYVGVDVFFVISGYLITGLLVRTAMRDGRISLLDFYSRRARRLLPVATLVLASAFAGTFLFLPEARWSETVVQIAASALYVQNWALAWLSVDYLGAENVASPVQHYWSLSIEEQFYFIWPLVMIGALALAHRLGLSLRRVFIIALAAIFAGSFIASVVITANNPAWAYFITHTRMWELALGGLLAMTIHRISIPAPLARASVMLTGLAAILISAFAYSPATPFPGWLALVPTMGTVLIIVAGDVRLGLFRGLDTPLLRYVGDRSYSIYLWHWPLIVFFLVGREGIEVMEGIGLIAVTLILSHLSYQHVEERFRHPRKPLEWRPIGYALASVAICVASSAAVHYSIASQDIGNAPVDDPDYPGPAALLADAPVPENVELIPASAALRRDLPMVYELGCHQEQAEAAAITCLLGDPDGSRTMVIMGDSHAAQWIPALDQIAKENGWKLFPFTKSACPFSRVRTFLQGGQVEYTSCSEWRENAIREIAHLQPDLIFTSQLRRRETDELVEGTRAVWSELLATGAEVIAIADTPRMAFHPEECLASQNGLCFTPRKDAAQSEPMLTAKAEAPDIKFIDMIDGFCTQDECPIVIGNVIAWRDTGHITATYSAMLAPYLSELSGVSY